MVAAPMALIQMSVDGSNPETHNAARPGQKKSHNNFNDVIAGCEAIQEEKKKRGQKLPRWSSRSRRSTARTTSTS